MNTSLNLKETWMEVLG